MDYISEKLLKSQDSDVLISLLKWHKKNFVPNDVVLFRRYANSELGVEGYTKQTYLSEGCYLVEDDLKSGITSSVTPLFNMDQLIRFLRTKTLIKCGVVGSAKDGYKAVCIYNSNGEEVSFTYTAEQPILAWFAIACQVHSL